MTTYSWTFSPFAVAPEYNGLANVIRAIPYSYMSDGNPAVGVSGTVDLPDPDPATFVPYASVTRDMVVAWITAQIGSEASLQAALAAQAAPQPDASDVVPMAAPF